MQLRKLIGVVAFLLPSLLLAQPTGPPISGGAARLEMEVGRQWVLAPGVEWVYFDGGREGWGYSVALRWKIPHNNSGGHM